MKNKGNVKTLIFLHFTFSARVFFLSAFLCYLCATYQDIIWTEIPGIVTPMKLRISTPIRNVLYWSGITFGIGQQEQNSKPKHQQSMPLLEGKSAMWTVLWDRPTFLLKLWHSWHDFKKITSLSAAASYFTYEPILLQMFAPFSRVWLLNSKESCSVLLWAGPRAQVGVFPAPGSMAQHRQKNKPVGNLVWWPFAFRHPKAHTHRCPSAFPSVAPHWITHGQP